MHRASSAWMLLLAILLGVSPRAGRPGELPAGEARLGAAAGAASLEAYYVRGTAKLHAALETRLLADRQTAPLGSALRAGTTLPRFTDLPLGAHPPRSAVRPTGQARHFPLFPTGPPSYT